MIFLSTLAYSKNANPDVIQILLGFTTVPELRQITMPHYASFLEVLGYSPSKDELTKLFNRYARPFGDCPESRLDKLPGERWSEADAFHRRQYTAAVDARVDICVENLLNQWPTYEVSIPLHEDVTTYVNVAEAMVEARSLFRHWFCNYEFQNYIRKIQAVVDRSSEYPSPEKFSFVVPKFIYKDIKGYVTIEDLLAKPAPAQNQQEFAEGLQGLVAYTLESSSPDPQTSSTIQHKEKLTQLLGHLTERASGTYERLYVQDLKSSHEAFRQSAIQPSIATEDFQPLFHQNLKETRLCVDQMYQAILTHLQRPVNSAEEVCRLASMSPRLSPSIVLSYLAQSSRKLLSDDWKAVIVHFGVAITSLQRAERLIGYAGSNAELLNELSNPGHLEWNPLDYPDWLLLELENNILIRSEQAHIAKQMISPISGCNSIMQLNMGLGKSSVIVPIVAATLADRQKLARVVVLKSLAAQMFQILLKRLGGLINRRIFFLPISRSLKLNASVAKDIRKIYEECMRMGGVRIFPRERSSDSTYLESGLQFKSR
jgi:hypothetical protein